MSPGPDVPRVDFYILSEGVSRERFTCDLAGKVRGQDKTIHIHTGSREAAQALDTLMWTFRDISFLPHSLAGEESAMDTITIGWEDNAGSGKTVMVNLTDGIPDDTDAFERVLEIVEAGKRQDGRRRYRQYRDAGFEMHNHDLSKGNEPA